MKKIVSYVLACIMMLMIMAVPSYDTYAANLSLSVSASSVNIGDTVTVTVSVPSGITATVDVYFPTNLFNFVSASGTTNVNGGTVATTLGDPFSSSVTIKLKAKTTGTASISASAIKAGDNNNVDADGNPTPIALGGASKSVTIANKTVTEPETPNTGNEGNNNSETTDAPKSADNSLSSLKISAGTLSPSFKYNVTKYTATVDYDVTKLVVSAKTSNAKATIESVTGNGNVSLNVGENTIQVVVKAENGVQATYIIVVTRKEKETGGETTPSETPSSETPDDPQNSEETDDPQNSENSEEPQDTQAEEPTFEYNGQKLNIIEEIPAEAIPADFAKENLLIDGKEIPGLSFTKGELQALYLANEAGYGSLYVYDKAEQNIYPLIKLISEKNYVIVLRPNDGAIPEGFTPCTLSIEGKGTVQAYRYEEEAQDAVEGTETTGVLGAETYLAAEPNLSDFYLIYCVNSNGEYGWYHFDAVEQTFQRYLGEVDSANGIVDVDAVPENNAEAQLKALKNRQKIMIGIFVVVVLVLLAAVISLTVSKRKLSQAYDKSYAYEEADIKQQEEMLDAAEDNEMSLAEMQTVSSFEEMIESYEASEDDDTEIAFSESQEEAKINDFNKLEEIIEETTAELKNKVEDAFFDMSTEIVKETENAESEDEMEIEFFEMPTEMVKETENTESENEVEVAFFNMSDESMQETALTESEDEVEIEFFEMPTEMMEEAETEDKVAIETEKTITKADKNIDAEEAFKLNLEKELAATDKKQANQSNSDDEDDDLEFIDL